MRPFVHRAQVALALWCTLLLISATTVRANRPPTAQEVMAAAGAGADATDTQALHAGALRFMAQLVGGMLAEEAGGDALLKQAGEGYAQQAKVMEEATAATLSDAGGADGERTRFRNAISLYEGDALLRKRCAEAFYPADVLPRFTTWEAARWEQENPNGTGANGAPVETPEEREDRVRSRLFADASLVLIPLYLVVAVCVVLAVVGVLRELRPSGLDPADPGHYRMGGRSFVLKHHTGVATGTETAVLVSHHSTVDANGRLSSSTSSHRQRSFHLRDAVGAEHPYDLPDDTFSVRDGNVVSAIWAIAHGQARGPVVMLYNHHTNVCKWLRAGMAPLVQYRRRTLVLLLVGALATMLAFTLHLRMNDAAARLVHGVHGQGWMPRNVFKLFSGTTLLLALVVPVIGWVFLHGRRTLRAEHLVNELGPRWVEDFREQAMADGLYARPPRTGPVQNI